MSAGTNARYEGTATARLARTMVSGVMNLAVRHGAIASNPVRDIGRIVKAPARTPPALMPDEQRAWIERLSAGEDARREDLTELCKWMLGNGMRIGERWPSTGTRST